MPEDIILQGPTGAGKTFPTCALANKACQDYKAVLYLRADDLFDKLTIAEKTNTRSQVLKRLVSLDPLIIDDWFLTAPTRDQVNLHAIIDRITTGAHTVTLTCTDSMRRHFATHP